jgi:tetratricopeptide (TPR) repeat protein
LFELHPNYLSQNLLPYLVLLNNLTVAQINLKKYTEAKETIAKIYNTISSHYSSHHIPAGVIPVLFKACNEELNIAVETLNTKDINTVIEKSEALIEKYGDVIGNRFILEFYNVLGILFFIMGQHKSALKWLNKMLYQKEQQVYIPLMNITYSISIMIHYDLGDLSHADYLLRSILRKVKNNKQEETFDVFFLEYMSKKILPLNPAEKKVSANTWIEFKNELINKYSINSNDQYWLLFTANWIQSKIEKTSLAKIISDQGK